MKVASAVASQPPQILTSAIQHMIVALQVRDEFRQDYDAGRFDPMLDIYSEGMGPHSGLRVGGKRARYSEHAHGSNKRAAVDQDRRPPVDGMQRPHNAARVHAAELLQRIQHSVLLLYHKVLQPWMCPSHGI